MHVIDAQFPALTVDVGRSTAQNQGFCESGPMDWEAFRWSQWLCHNDCNNVVLEMVADIEVTFSKDISIAVCGPGADLGINGQYCALWHTHNAPAGALITVKPHHPGQRHYLAVSGGFKVPLVAGSACTVMREGLGGPDGKGHGVRCNDTLLLAAPQRVRQRTVNKVLRPEYTSNRPFNVIEGYQVEQFDRLNRARFYASEYLLSNQVDRMGYRLVGPAVNAGISKMYSEAIQSGAIQFPGDGQPIVLLADRQTLGGYPKIGCIAPSDLSRFVQRLPQSKLYFSPVNVDNARAAALLKKQLHQRYMDKF